MDIHELMRERLAKYDDDIGPSERVESYNKFCGSYEVDVNAVGYSAPRVCAELAAQLTGENKDELWVLDVASGTGLVGEQLVRQGFKIIDGLDPSTGMNKIAGEKNIYRNFYTDFLTAEPITTIPKDTYDVVTVAGAFQHGQVPYDAILEMMRVTKPGGIICITSRKEAFYQYEEYKELIPLCNQLEKQNRLKKEIFENFNDYHPTLEGTKIVYRVL